MAKSKKIVKINHGEEVVPVAVHQRKDPEMLILDVVQQIEPGCPLDPIARAYGLLSALKDTHDRLKQMVNEAVEEKIRADGPFVMGEDKFYVGKKKETEQVETNHGVYERLMDVTGGDMVAVIDCLCSQPFKQGTVHKLLKEKIGGEADAVFFELFTVTEVEKVTTGKPTKQDGSLQRISLDVLRRIGAR